MILVNTVVLAMEYYGMSATYEYVVIMFNLVLTCIFTAEMILKLIALGFHGYVKDRFNIFRCGTCLPCRDASASLLDRAARGHDCGF